MAHYRLSTESSERQNKQDDDQDSSAADNETLLEKHLLLQAQEPFHRRHFKIIVLHSLFCTFNLVLYIAIWHLASKDCPFGVYGPGLVYSMFITQEIISNLTLCCVAPATDAIAYESQMWDSTNIFFTNGSVNPNRQHKEFGPPSPESDAAWAKLIRSKYCSVDPGIWVEVTTDSDQNLRIKKEELGQYHDRPGLVKVADGSGYYATLSAYHSLHCKFKTEIHDVKSDKRRYQTTAPSHVL